MSLFLLFHPGAVTETTDTDVVYLTLTPSATEFIISDGDSDTVYLDIQIFSLQIYGILEIISNVRRWDTLTGTRRYDILGSAIRWEEAMTEVLRWTILNIRRYRWRS